MIFADYAPIYWAANLPVIPLRERNKMPDILQWSLYGREMPSQAMQEHWLASFPRGNIGLPFGPASGLCAIDIDTEDDALCSAIEEIIGPSPWVRVGKKGKGIVYRWQGQKNFKLRGADGGMICEFLGMGNQMVLPPSIHPDTGRPYVSTTNLWEVLTDIPTLPLDIEGRLRTLLGAKGYSIGAGGRSAPLDIIPAGERDVQMVRHAGYLARVVLGIDRSQTFSLHEAIEHMHHWVQEFTARVNGDEMDPSKGVAKLLEFILKDLEKGRTLPEGWNSDLPESWLEHPTVAAIAERNDNQRWSVSRAREWLVGKISERPDDLDWALDRIKEVIGSCAADDQFTEFDMRTLVSFIQGVARELDLKKTDLLQLFKAERKAATSGDMETQAAVAKAVLEELERIGEIRFDQGQFWQWTGSCFSVLPEEALYMHIANNVKDSLLVRRHSEYTAVVQVLERMCRSELTRENGLNFANGFVGEDLILQDHDAKYGATFTLPFNYEPDAASRCNRWLEFLYSCWGQEPDYEDRVKALQEMFASTLFGLSTRYQRAFLLYGQAETGKTQVLKVLRALLPPNAASDLGPQLWGERFTLTDLIGKAANICGELPEQGFISGNIFKQVIEGEPIRGEFKGQDGFVFFPICAHWFASNHLPVSRDSTRGFSRRWHVLHFGCVVRPDQRVENLAESIVAEEREAIAAWALEGVRRVIDQRGYTEPTCHTEYMAAIRRNSNSVIAFLEDDKGIIREDGVEINCRELYDLYSFHHKDRNSSRPVSYERFTHMLEDLGLVLDRRVDLLGQLDLFVKGVAQRAGRR